MHIFCLIFLIKIALQYSICEILKVVVEFGGDAVDALLHHIVHQPVQLVFRQVQVKPEEKLI